MSLPSAPNPRVVSGYLQQWEQLENYRLQEQSLSLLFKELCPANEVLEHILLKVSALNDFYSTNIFDTYSVAKHILSMKIDQRLQSGDLSLVNELAKVILREKPRNFYSFASKYCSHHFPEKFPIYDSFVEKMLVHYDHADRFSRFHKADLKHYELFVKVIKDFQSHYGLGRFTLRQIDIFLWLAGKDSFPRNYGGGTTASPQGAHRSS